MTRVCVIFFILFAKICFSQWQFQNPVPTGYVLSNIVKVNNFSAIALGRENTILKTTNRGVNWITCATSPDTSTLNGGYIFNDNNYIVVGNNGQILRTYNGGINWTKINLQYNYFLQRINFLNSMTGYITGNFGGVLKSTDGGGTWSWMNFNFTFNDLFFVSSNKLVTYTNQGTVYLSTNGGTNWTASDYLIGGIIKSMQFTDSSTGYLCNADNKIFKTTNQGGNWIQISTTPLVFNQIYFKDASNAFGCTTADSAFYFSTNSGSTWSRIPFFTKDYLKKFIFFDDAAAAGITTTYRILNTPNYISGWYSASNDVFSSVQSNSFGKVNFFDLNTGVVSCRTGIFITTNSGSDWTFRYISDESYIGESFVNNNTIISVGGNLISTFNLKAAIFRSTNNGNNWSTVFTSSTENTSCRDIAMINANTGFACIDGGVNSVTGVLKTTNAGVNWSFLSLGDTLQPIAISFNNNLGVLISRTKVLVSTNTGETWNTKYLSTGTLNDLNLQNNNIYVLTDTSVSFNTRAKILKSTDSGNTWITRIAPDYLSPYPTSFHMLNDNIGFISTLSTLYYTTDYFQTAAKVFNAPVNIDHVQFSFLNENTGWILSAYNGFLWKTTNKGGIIGIRKLDTEIIPKDFVLQNNYPNPFNPVTTIKFSIPNSTHVKLKIFDIKGKEISQLVNDFLSQGVYEYTFNASLLSSGVYFYQLETSSASSTKKMILLK